MKTKRQNWSLGADTQKPISITSFILGICDLEADFHYAIWYSSTVFSGFISFLIKSQLPNLCSHPLCMKVLFRVEHTVLSLNFSAPEVVRRGGKRQLNSFVTRKMHFIQFSPSTEENEKKNDAKFMSTTLSTSMNRNTIYICGNSQKDVQQTK